MSAEPATTDVLLVDDHPLLQLGLQRRLAELGLEAIAADISCPENLFAQANELRPTAIVLDYGLPTLGDGLGLIQPLVENGSRVLMLTGTNGDELWGQLIAAGAEGVISKAESLEVITDAILAVVAGQPIRVQARAALLGALDRSRAEKRNQLAPFESLTTRESIILEHVRSGNSPATIAQLEFVSIDTVRSQIKSILRKLGVSSQLEAVALAHHVRWTVTPSSS